MEKAARQITCVIRGTKAEYVHVCDWACPEARAENISVDSDDAGHGAAKGIQRTGGVVSFSFDAKTPIRCPLNDARVVMENTQ